MKISYHPKSQLEKFGLKVYKELVENFPQTFFVGGMVRDLLLNRKIVDVDIATVATPEDVIKILKHRHIQYNDSFKNYGVIIAKQGNKKIEIVTFRKEVYAKNRYPKVTYAQTAKVDSSRRDFTVNALYLQAKTGGILDFYNSIRDLNNRSLKFIGTPSKRIQEDPLRVIRALRFALDLNFTIENKSKLAIKKYFFEVKKLTSPRIVNELKKVLSEKNKKIIQEVINNPQVLDKYF